MFTHNYVLKINIISKMFKQHNNSYSTITVFWSYLHFFVIQKFFCLHVWINYTKGTLCETL